jgi:hypothetical protein
LGAKIPTNIRAIFAKNQRVNFSNKRGVLAWNLRQLKQCKVVSRVTFRVEDLIPICRQDWSGFYGAGGQFSTIEVPIVRLKL